MQFCQGTVQHCTALFFWLVSYPGWFSFLVASFPFSQARQRQPQRPSLLNTGRPRLKGRTGGKPQASDKGRTPHEPGLYGCGLRLQARRPATDPLIGAQQLSAQGDKGQANRDAGGRTPAKKAVVFHQWSAAFHHFSSVNKAQSRGYLQGAYRAWPSSRGSAHGDRAQWGGSQQSYLSNNLISKLTPKRG